MGLEMVMGLEIFHLGWLQKNWFDSLKDQNMQQMFQAIRAQNGSEKRTTCLGKKLVCLCPTGT